MTALLEESHMWHPLPGAWLGRAESAPMETWLLSTSQELGNLRQCETRYLEQFRVLGSPGGQARHLS